MIALLFIGFSPVRAKTRKVSLEELYMHCPEQTELAFKEINGNFGIKLKTKDCNLGLIESKLAGNDIDPDLEGESAARVRRIKNRKLRIAQMEF